MKLVATLETPSRRAVLKTIGLGASAALLPRPALAQGTARVVVVGGGFAGASCARELQKAGSISVRLVEANPTFTACPFSNGVIAGLRDLREQEFGYDV